MASSLTPVEHNLNTSHSDPIVNSRHKQTEPHHLLRSPRAISDDNDDDEVEPDDEEELDVNPDDLSDNGDEQVPSDNDRGDELDERDRDEDHEEEVENGKNPRKQLASRRFEDEPDSGKLQKLIMNTDILTNL